MWKYFNILYMTMVRVISPERRARTRSGHNVRRQTEGYLSWGILGTRATMKKRQLYYCRGKNCLVIE